jgi:hypothetical protein
MNVKVSGILLTLIVILVSSYVHSQDVKKEVNSRIHVGLEQDILPYVLGGFIGTGWIGKKHVRVRVSYAEANTPKLVIQDEIKKDRTNAVGISAEYFSKEKFKGLWFGPGIGYWKNEVVTSNNQTAFVKSWVFSLGGGYIIFLWKGLYTTPWLALHARIAGNKSRYIDAVKYKPMLFTPEASLKLGWMF